MAALLGKGYDKGTLDHFTITKNHLTAHSTPSGTDNTSQGMINTFNTLLHPGMPDLKVTIHEQNAEIELVTTRKNISGTHTGILLEIPPTGKQINIEVIDIVRIKDGKYFKHWGINTFQAVVQQLKAAL